ncbi:Type-1 restriction enzyme EcoKI specificity protein [Methanosarcinales archaeon]|nr:restriction endonuclease subunit S [Candidatus Methanoperedens sp.]CAG1000475.1 Type-1 restriction enzyme EcoKI specificity protein [Methanosarcinales archaeon]
MIEGLKPYAEYKEVGLPWLGKIPKHWEVCRGKSVFKSIDVRSKAGEEELLTVSSKDGVVLRREKNVTMFMAESYEGYKLCWPGDLVINSLWAWAGGLGFSRHHGIISSAYGVYRPREEFSGHWKYFDYLLRSIVYDWEFHVRSKGIWVSRLQLTDTSFLDMPIILPPNNEAVAIAQFLTGESSLINRFIRTKRRLIELLNEQKQAIIHQAVTCGLDPNVHLKPSGIDWLGEVPEHWEVVPLKRPCVLIRDGTHLPPPRVDKGIPLLSVRNIINGKFVMRDDDSQISETDYRVLCKSFEVRQYDILLAIVGGTLGKVAIVQDMPPFHIQRSLSVLRAKQTVLDYRFLAYFLQGPGFQRALWQTVAFSAQPGIYLGTIINFPVVLPPLDEQKILVSTIDEAIKDVECSIKATYKEIDLLREYRTRLISDVVTGKLDVRGVELPAMDEAETIEDIDTIEDIETESKELIETEEVANADN